MSARARAFLSRIAPLAAAVLAFSAGQTAAVQAPPSRESDIRRFNLDRPAAPAGREPAARTLAAVREFRRIHGSGLRVLFHPRTGAVELMRGFAARPRTRDPEQAARLFLDDHQDLLQVRSADLRLLVRRGRGHLLFQQLHRGVPVEFSRVGVHSNRRGEIHYVHSSFEPAIAASPVPALSEDAARAAAAADAGARTGARGELVYMPSPADGEMRLAWKFRFAASRPPALWVYYVDAATGAVLLRYDDLRYQTFVTSGTVQGGAFRLNPFETCSGSAPTVAFPHANVWAVDSTSAAVTDADGFYSFGIQGRIFTALRGPYASLSHAKLPNASYDNGSGQWFPFPTPVSSPHPYPPNADLTQTITGPQEALRLRAHFSSFDVGEASDEGSNDDQVFIEDAAGARVAAYIGPDLGPFLSADVTGRSMTLRLVSDDSVEGDGYAVDVSSYFKFLDDPTSAHPDRSTYDVFWSTRNTGDQTWDESNAFYQVNAMHDFFSALDEPEFPIDVDVALPVSVQHGVGYQNAFYNPSRVLLVIGGGIPGACQAACGNILDCSFALDSSVVRHEYAHFAALRIYPLGNTGQAGAISEALADYFALSSIGYPRIGEFVTGDFSPLRNLDDGIGDGSNQALLCSAGCSRMPGNWSGEIHDDGQILAQALWSIRQVLGAARADLLAYRTHFYFPASFREFREAYLQLDLDEYGAGAGHTFIENAFTVHGISGTVTGEDLNEPNDGPQTATDLSAVSSRSGTVYPVADQDFFAFTARPGRIAATLRMPPRPGVPGEYTALGLGLYDDRNNLLGYAMARPENATLGGNCPETGDCRTGDAELVLPSPIAAAGRYYLAVGCGQNDTESLAPCTSLEPYSLSLAAFPDDARAASGIAATQSGDAITFSLPLTAYGSGATAPWAFTAPPHCATPGSARLRDHNLQPLLETDSGTGAVPLLALNAPTIAGGSLSGRYQIHPGTRARYPAVGTVYLEILGVNNLCSIQSLGLSGALAMSASGAGGLSAWNNVMNPLQGGRATLRVTVAGSGRTTLKLLTLKGETVRNLFDGVVSGGLSVDWDGRNDSGTVVASGIYLAHVKGPGVNKTQKVVVVK